MVGVEDMGTVLMIADVPWAQRQMWAPNATLLNGSCLVYFSAKNSKDILRIGVATSTSPYGPVRSKRN
jgi:hypothetical protein